MDEIESSFHFLCSDFKSFVMMVEEIVGEDDSDAFGIA